MSKTETLYDKLAAHFDQDQHKQRWADKKETRKLTYIPAEAIISRLNEVFGIRWSWQIIKSEIDIIQRVAIVTGVLIYQDEDGSEQQKYGIGADQGGDWAEFDKLVKTANTEAIKNAAKLIGVGLYLYDDEERAAIDRELAAQAPKSQTAASHAPQQVHGGTIQRPAVVSASNGTGEYKILKCKNCEMPVVWVNTAAGKRMPVDAGTIQDDGSLLFDKRKGHVSHYDTCLARREG